MMSVVVHFVGGNHPIKKIKNNDLTIVSVNIGESELVVNQFTDQFNLTFPITIDKQEDIQKHYNVYNLPASFLVILKAIPYPLKFWNCRMKPNNIWLTPNLKIQNGPIGVIGPYFIVGAKKIDCRLFQLTRKRLFTILPF